MKIYYQLVDNNDNSLTSTQADVESKLFATAKLEKGETEFDMDTLKSEATAKAEQIQKASNLNRPFELKSEYESQKGNKGYFFVVPDII